MDFLSGLSKCCLRHMHTHTADEARGYLGSNLGRRQRGLLNGRARNEDENEECDDKNMMEPEGNPERRTEKGE